MDEPQTSRVTAKALYDELVQDRDPFIKRARRAAELTVPQLVPPDAATGATSYTEPAQSLGSRGIRHMASKVLNTLFPANTPFFYTKIDDITLRDITGAEDKRGEMETALSIRDKATHSEIQYSMFRPVAFEGVRQLLVSGNYLFYIPQEGKVRGYKLTSYVVRRDASGNLLDLVIKESVAKTALPAEIRNALPPTEAASPRDKNIDVYTHAALDEKGENFIVVQEINGVVVGGDYEGSYPKDKFPWVPIRFSYIEGEDYGRGFVEEYIGDLNALEQMTIALRDGTVQGAKVVWLVAPNAVTKIDKLSKAPNGGFVTGKPDDVVPMRLEKQADFAVCERYIAQLSERLSFAFMLNTAVQRSGERVTAEEIRYMANELDQGLGGVYSLLSEEWQLPSVKLFEMRMERRLKVPPLPTGSTSTSIVAGLDALGRSAELQNLDMLIAGSMQVVGPEQVSKYLNVGEYFKRRGAALGIDMGGLIRTDEEIAKSEQQAQLQQLAQHLGPQAISQMGGAARDQIKQSEGPPVDG